VSDAPLEINADAHIIVNNAQGAIVGGDGVRVEEEDGIVPLELDDSFAMGAPPGARRVVEKGYIEELYHP
jgi:hypothetical protein